MAEARLLVVGSRALWVRSDRELVDRLQEGQLTLVFPLGTEVRGMAAAVANMAREPGLDVSDLGPSVEERRCRTR